MNTPKNPPATRRYVVTDAHGNERLIKATGAGQAVVHVYQPNVRVATPDDIDRLVSAGIKTEDATKPANAELPLT